MNYNEFSKVMIINFIASIVITVMLCFVLNTVKIDNLAYLGVLFGLYVFAGFGINRLIDDNIIPNNHYRFILAIICIIIYDIAFIYVIPFVLGANFFTDSYILSNLGYGDLVLDKWSFLIIFDLIVLIANYFSYR